MLLFDFINAKESMKGKGKQSSAKIVFEKLKKTLKSLILIKCHISIDNSNAFFFLSCREKAHDNKEFGREN